VLVLASNEFELTISVIRLVAQSRSIWVTLLHHFDSSLSHANNIFALYSAISGFLPRPALPTQQRHEAEGQNTPPFVLLTPGGLAREGSSWPAPEILHYCTLDLSDNRSYSDQHPAVAGTHWSRQGHNPFCGSTSSWASGKYIGQNDDARASL
jgi:hypothetical protein